MWLRRLNVVASRTVCYRRISVKARIETMQDGYVVLNKVPTHIYTWGHWIEDKFDERTKEIVVIVTGNPGLPGFYTKFCSALYEELDKNVPIWVIGHAGHDEPKKELNLVTPKLKGNEQLYDLQGQLDHKTDFINRYVPKDVRVYLVGHSIGSKLCLDLLKIPQFTDQVQQAYLMFPVIERIGESKRGKLVHTYNRVSFLFRAFYNVLHLFPSTWKQNFVRWHCRREEIPEEFFESTLEYTNPPVFERIWFLAVEARKVREIDEEIIRSNINRLKLYYAAVDDWVSAEFFHELREKFPGIDAQMCQLGYEHAFVLKSSPEVGKMVSGWIQQKRQILFTS